MGRIKGDRRFTAENPGGLGEDIIIDLVGAGAVPKRITTKTWCATFSVRGWRFGVQQGVVLRVTTDSREGYNVFTSHLSPSAARELVLDVKLMTQSNFPTPSLKADRKLAKWLLAAFKSALKRRAP